MDTIVNIMDANLETRDVFGVPTIDDITFNEGTYLDTAIIFCDVRDSSLLADDRQRRITAKILKTFLSIATLLAQQNRGEVRSINGDGLMVVFNPDNCCDNAVTMAMKMKYVTANVLAPYIYRKYNQSFDMGIGISYGRILAVKAGLPGENNRDLIWVGSPTNKAAKLSNKGSKPYNIYITQEVFNRISKNLKYKTVNLLPSPFSWPTSHEIWAGEYSLLFSPVHYRTSYHIPIE